MTDQNCVSSTGPAGCYRVRCAPGKVCAAALECAPTYPQNAAKNYMGLDMSPAQPTAQASAEPKHWLVERHYEGGARAYGYFDNERDAQNAVRTPEHIITPLYTAPAASATPAAPSVSADPLQELADQAQALDMGYGPNACQACGKSVSAAPVVPEDKKLAHGHRDDFYLLANARMIVAHKWRRQPNWVLAMRLFATGSTSAQQICRDAGINPDGFKAEREAAPKEPTT